VKCAFIDYDDPDRNMRACAASARSRGKGAARQGHGNDY
jgi:hypothetical protein